MRDFGLVHNDSNPDQYWRIVSYELVPGAYPDDALEMQKEHGIMTVVPVRREYRLLDVSNPKSLGYSGPDWKMVVVRVTELERMPVFDSWPSWVNNPETEELRRRRIRHLRQASHVDPNLGAQEPVWKVAHVSNDNRPVRVHSAT